MDSGFLLINKPLGDSSFFVVKKLRQITHVKKIGHAGTLDPLATGLLICAVGRTATKQIDQIKGLTKEYLATIEFGRTSSSYDLDGEITVNNSAIELSKEKIEETLKNFLGEQVQMPPIFSAKKINGVPAYKLARRGLEVAVKPAKIRINQLEILSYKWPVLELRVICGAGTYIRSLAHDLGQKLGPGALLIGLKRTHIGSFTLSGAKELTDLNNDNWAQFLLPTVDKTE
jgi:tRNA pseudouridine55 synthase